MGETKTQLLASVDAVAGGLRYCPASELDRRRMKNLATLGTGYKTDNSRASVWADTIGGYAGAMRDG